MLGRANPRDTLDDVAEGRRDASEVWEAMLGEFKDGKDVELATELLERLRTFGVDAGGTEDAGDDDSLARAADPAPGSPAP